MKNEHSKLLKGLEIKEKAGIFQPAVCIGDTNAMNLEQGEFQTLLLRTDYYQATLEQYEEIKMFMDVNLFVM